MRDAFGGAFMIQVLLVFMFIYIGFTAVALNYAKAFKVKNMLVDYLEDNEIMNLNDLTANEEQAMSNFIEHEIYGNMNYHVNVEDMCSGINTTDEFGNKIAYCNDIGVFIKQQKQSGNTKGVYYTVSTYAGWSIPFLNKLLALNGTDRDSGVVIGVWRVSGETRLIINE